MVKYRIYNPIYFAFILLTLSLSSCKDWLTIAPENDLIKEKFWAKTEDVYSSLGATYDAYRDGAFASFIWGEVRADLVTFGKDFGDYNRIAGSDIAPNNGAIKWDSYYKAINLANTLMYYDKQVISKDESFTQEMLDGVDAEALFIRSLSYFYLVRVWKDVPLVLEPSISDTSNLFVPKSSESVVVDQIIKDLLKAKDLAYTIQYKNDTKHPAYFTGRANKYSIMALLADVYLWDQQYQKCSDYCDSVSNSGLYSLEPTDTWFDLYYPGNSQKESIFEIQYDHNYPNQDNPLYSDLLFKGQLDFTTDLLTILPLEDYRACGGQPDWKYLGLSYYGTSIRNSFQKDGNFIYYRYADILLMKAEALCELNRFQEANEYARQTDERAGMTFGNYVNKEELRKAILDERGREFVIEGKRWFDLLRAAKRNKFEKKQMIIDMILAGANIQQQAILRTKVYDTMSYYLPIPVKEISTNPNLVQNPFYDR
jgi:hypothetical protein